MFYNIAPSVSSLVRYSSPSSSLFFFFNDTATTEIYTLSLHDALPIFVRAVVEAEGRRRQQLQPAKPAVDARRWHPRSEEHTSELQSRRDLVCRLLLEKKKKKAYRTTSATRKFFYAVQAKLD